MALDWRGAWVSLGCLLLVAPVLAAGEIYVNNQSGDDGADGMAQTPLRSARRAVGRAAAGDVIHLLPEGAVYREMITLADKRDIAIEGHNITIRNLNAAHVLNDGFNIHGNAQDLHLFNISAYGCFDNGISPHGACSFDVQDGQFVRNEMAVGNDFLTETRFLRCTIADSTQEEIMIIGGRHLFEDCRIRSAGPVAVRLGYSRPGASRPMALKEIAASGKDPDMKPQYTFRRCAIESADGKGHAFVVGPGLSVIIEDCTFKGIEFHVDAKANVQVSGSTADGQPLTEEVLRRPRPVGAAPVPPASPVGGGN